MDVRASFGRLLGLLLTWLVSASGAAEVEETAERSIGLREVASWAAREPPAVKAARLRVEAAGARVGVQRAGYAPKLVTQADLALVQQQQLYFVPDAPNPKTNSISTRIATSADLEWTLFDALGRPARVAQAKEARALAQELATKEKFDSVRAACELYVSLLTTQRLAENAGLSIARRTAISRAIARLIDAGIRPRVDLARAEVEVLAARAELSVLRAQSRAQGASLAAAMGLDPKTTLAASELESTLLEATFSDEQADARALLGRPEVAAQHARIREREFARRAARAERLPSLHLIGSASLSRDSVLRGDGINGNAFVLLGGLSVRWNALDLTVVRNQAAVTAELEVELTALRDATLQTRTAALVGRRELLRATEALEQATQILEAARIARDAQDRRYQSGEAPLLELLDAEQIEQEARVRRILAQRDLDLARIAMLDALGLLTKRLVS